jgi:hypothetical protein
MVACGGDSGESDSSEASSVDAQHSESPVADPVAPPSRRKSSAPSKRVKTEPKVPNVVIVEDVDIDTMTMKEVKSSKAVAGAPPRYALKDDQGRTVSVRCLIVPKYRDIYGKMIIVTVPLRTLPTGLQALVERLPTMPHINEYIGDYPLVRVNNLGLETVRIRVQPRHALTPEASVDFPPLGEILAGDLAVTADSYKGKRNLNFTLWV